MESACSTGASRREKQSQSRKNAKFPVKFPVCREFVWRLVRSALRRQPGRRLEILPRKISEMPAIGGLLRFSRRTPNVEFSQWHRETFRFQPPRSIEASL